jgi:predicted ATPase
MSKIKIKHFGPIKEGCLENDGWIEIKKVTLFIGNQASGKSSIAKVISTLMYLEKAINRGDIALSYISKVFTFKKLFNYQGIFDYFTHDSEIEYVGEEYSIKFGNKEVRIKKIYSFDDDYVVPKIMYIPAERNILSTISNVLNVTGMPEHLFTFAEELKKAQKELNGLIIDLPINNYNYDYDPMTETSFVVGPDHKINLLKASSGLQSIIPLFLVSRNLALLVNQSDEVLRKNMNAELSIRMNEEIISLMLKSDINENARNKELQSIRSKYLGKCLINIVEEPEQNLYPTSQWQMLKSLLEFNNMSKHNKLIMTTHSPYIINYLTLAVKAFELKQIVKSNELRNNIELIVPFESAVDSNDLVIYELNEKDGTIKKLEDYKGLPSDENQLNERLGESNELFARLLEIQQGI